MARLHPQIPFISVVTKKEEGKNPSSFSWRRDRDYLRLFGRVEDGAFPRGSMASRPQAAVRVNRQPTEGQRTPKQFGGCGSNPLCANAKGSAKRSLALAQRQGFEPW